MAGSYCFASQAQVLTQHNTISRTGWYDQETILNTKNVKLGSFGMVFDRAVDDQIYAQPLVARNISLPGVGSRNVVFVATVNNSVYAFEADSPSVTAPYWNVNLSPVGSRAIKNTDMSGACGGNYLDFSGSMGIVSTPVIDTTTNTMYVLSRNRVLATSVFQQFLHALDLSTGAEKANSPKLISAQINGNGDGSVGGKISFDSQKQNQRAGLLLLDGIVYLAWASHCDWAPYHGWIMGFNATTLALVSKFNDSPDGREGGIWMAGGAPAFDASNNLYVITGNGDFNADSATAPNQDYGDSFLRLTSSLAVADYFTPFNQEELDRVDADLGSGGALVLPDEVGSLAQLRLSERRLLHDCRSHLDGFDHGRIRQRRGRCR